MKNTSAISLSIVFILSSLFYQVGYANNMETHFSRPVTWPDAIALSILNNPGISAPDTDTVTSIPGKTSSVKETLEFLEEAFSPLARDKMKNFKVIKQGITYTAPEKRTTQQKINIEKLVQSVSEVWWPAVGAHVVTKNIRAIQTEITQLLSVPEKSDPFASYRQPLTSRQKDEIRKIQAELKQLAKNNNLTKSRLGKLLGLNENTYYPLASADNSTLYIPELIYTEPTQDQKALDNQEFLDKNAFNSGRKHLAEIMPSLLENWNNPSPQSTKSWLFASKHLAFSLQDLRKKQAKKNLFPGKSSETAEQSLLAAAVLARLHLAQNLYHHHLEKFLLSDCLVTTGEKILKLQVQPPYTSNGQAINIIRLKIQQIKMMLSHYQHYSELQSAFQLLSRNFRQPWIDLENASFQQLTELVKLNSLKLEKTSIPDLTSCNARVSIKHSVKSRPEPAKTKPASSRPADSTPNWLMKQNPKHYTLQILSSNKKEIVENYIQKFKLGKKAYIEKVSIKGKPVYRLLYGSYKDRESAFVGQFKLPLAVLKKTILIRKFGSLKK